MGELLVSLSYYPANNTLTLGVLKVTKSQDGEQKSLDLLTLQEAASEMHPKWQMEGF